MKPTGELLPERLLLLAEVLGPSRTQRLIERVHGPFLKPTHEGARVLADIVSSRGLSFKSVLAELSDAEIFGLCCRLSLRWSGGAGGAEDARAVVASHFRNAPTLNGVSPRDARVESGPAPCVSPVSVSAVGDMRGASTGHREATHGLPAQAMARNGPPTRPPLDSVLELGAAVALADGEYHAREEAQIWAQVRGHLPAVPTSERARLESALARLRDGEVDPVGVADALARVLDLAQRRRVIEHLVEVAFADGIFRPEEAALLDRLSIALGIDAVYFQSLVAMLRHSVEPSEPAAKQVPPPAGSRALPRTDAGPKVPSAAPARRSRPPAPRPVTPPSSERPDGTARPVSASPIDEILALLLER